MQEPLQSLFPRSRALALAALSCLVLSCKPTSKSTPIQTSKPSAAATPVRAANSSPMDDGCNPPSCPKAQAVLTVNGAPASTISGQVGVPQALQFGARSDAYPGRVFTAYKIEPAVLTSSMSILGNNSSSPSMNWAPYTNDPISGQITVRFRDMTACQKTNVADARVCNDFSKALEAFDSQASIPWSLTGSGNTGVTRNNTIPLGPILGTLGTILGGPAGGAVLGTIGGIIQNSNAGNGQTQGRPNP